MISLLTPERRILRSIRRACPSSSSIMMMVTGLLMGFSCSCVSVSVAGRPGEGQRYRECTSMVKFRGYQHGSPEPAHQRPNVGKANALSRFVLGAGAAEQVENPLVVLGIDAAAIVGDFENRKAEFGAAPGLA